MSDTMLSALVQVAVALIASGLAVKLLTLRQDRRKIAGEATTHEANAASTLSGAALQMVEAAQKNAREADTRAVAANENADECRKENERLWRELNKARWEIHWMQAQEAVLVATLERAGITVPQAPRPENGFPDFPPPDPPALGKRASTS
jgi:hypothetical protein